MVLLKIVGVLLMFVGVLIVRYFPGVASYQKIGMTLAGIWTGILLFLIGIVLLIYG